MKILLVSRLFWPKNAIGAVRPTNICREFSRMGHNIICISEGKEDEENFDLKNVEVFRVNSGRFGEIRKKRFARVSANENCKNEEIIKIKNKKSLGIKRKIKSQLSQLLFCLDEIEWARNAKKMSRKLIKEAKPDWIITSYGPFSTVIVGIALKKRFKDKIKWNLDLRDPMDVGIQATWRKKIGARIQLKALCNADLVTTVSDALKIKFEKLCRIKCNSAVNVYVIENGYSVNEDTLSCSEEKKKNNKMQIAYTGQLYNGKRDMAVLFEAICNLEKKNGKLPLEIIYAGRDYDRLLEQALPYNMENYIKNLGFVSHLEAVKIQKNADILCLLTWNTANEQGVITGKFSEYLKQRKAILAIVSGDLPDSEIKKRICEINAGFCYESCVSSIKEIQSWLENVLVEWKNNHYIEFKGIEDKVIYYSYPKIMQRYNNLLTINKKMKNSG